MNENKVLWCLCFSYMLMIIATIFLPCYYGSEVHFASEKLSSSLFHSEWYTENFGFKKGMIVFMKRVKQPIIITVFDVYDVNLGTFTFVCQSAYSLFAVVSMLRE